MGYMCAKVVAECEVSTSSLLSENLGRDFASLIPCERVRDKSRY